MLFQRVSLRTFLPVLGAILVLLPCRLLCAEGAYPIVGKADLMKPYTFDEGQLGYRPRYPEEEAERAKMRREAFSLVEAARRARQEPVATPATPRVSSGSGEASAPAAASAPPAAGSPGPPAPPS